MILRKLIALSLAALFCLSLFGCQREEEPQITAPSREDKPILTVPTGSADTPVTYTPVYATAFGDTIFLATVAITQWQGEEPDCPAREVSLGGKISCGGEHEGEAPITRVVITEELHPRSTEDWFRDMVSLERVEGLEKLRTDSVTDMAHMFAGCVRLSHLDADGWDVSGVEDMTGIFDGCDALAEKPAWYVPRTDQ